MSNINILAIESSCDETSMAIIRNGHECVSLTILSQMDIHASFGGVVPEIASRLHTENITMVLEKTLNKANMKIEDVDAIAVTYAPGLMGSLMVGVECAKTLALIYEKPLIKVNHIIGHIYANNIDNNMEYPLLALIVSGGHSELLIMNGDYEFNKLGGTLDDALGECYDKVARVIGMPYPGGPNVERCALEGKDSYRLTVPMQDNSYNLSFSGLKSNIINLVHNEEQRGNTINKNDLARSFQDTAVKEVTNKVELALKNYSNIKNMVIAGGVSANKYLRSEVEKVCNAYNVKLLVPKFVYCTDNAAMIGAAAYPLFLRKEFEKYDFNPQSQINIV